MESTREHDRESQESIIGWAIAIFGPIAVAALLVPFREDLVGTNLALILVVVVVAAAVAGGRGPGAAAAIVATVSYDFFLTKPYLSMNIESADDVETAVILLVIGLVVGQLVTITRRSRRKAERGAEEIARLHRVAEQAAQGADVGDVIRSTEAELSGLLELGACTYERTRSGPPLPRLERGGAVVGGTRRLVGEDFALPAEGVELPVLGRGKDFGRLVLTPTPRTPASIEERIVAVALSDLLGAALAATLDTDAGDLST